MKKLILTVAVSFTCIYLCPAQTSSTSTSGGSTAPYNEGPVWDITMVRTKPNMTDDYLKNLAGAYKATSEEAKKQGIIMDYKILMGDASNKDDFDVVLMVQYKNMAALDGLREKTDPIARKLIGTEDVMRQASVKRMEVRDILGTKTMREVTLK
ncbi:MAG TPA: hypothetical protein VJT71_06655 [Pyrinomonadaceae bacterium]|nr:hypothetical protein [Pyrinomonadaceae bacterium]